MFSSFLTDSPASEVNCEANAALEKQCEFLEAKQVEGRYRGKSESRRNHRRRGPSQGKSSGLSEANCLELSSVNSAKSLYALETLSHLINERIH